MTEKTRLPTIDRPKQRLLRLGEVFHCHCANARASVVSVGITGCKVRTERLGTFDHSLRACGESVGADVIQEGLRDA